MTCCTFKQFQGLWLGGVVSGLAVRRDNWLQTQTWLTARRTIALETWESMGLAVDLEPSPFTTDVDALPIANAKSINDNSLELILLPPTLLQSRLKLTQEISRFDLKSTGSTREIDILLWSRLLHLILSHRSELEEPNPHRVIELVLRGMGVKQTALVRQLEKVAEAWEEGLSLNQLVEILEGSNEQHMAIALAYYCFATTPDDFRLGVKRAASLNSQIAGSVCALAATLLGAYNGVTGIPRSWRAIAKQNHIYQQEQQIAALLFQAWMGKYALEPGEYSQNPIEAIALAQTIQPRKTLKIISQKSYLS